MPIAKWSRRAFLLVASFLVLRVGRGGQQPLAFGMA